MPHLDRLRAEGGFSRVATTTPAQTPVAWSTFATGTNPGGHGIFDFIRRDPRTYLPDLALNRYEARGAFLPPRAVNMRRGTPVWDVLSAAGIGSTILRCPVTYPPDVFRGTMLSGMGVPDLRGGLGTPTFYTSAENVSPRESENVVRVCPGADGTIETYLIGPRNPKDRSDVRFGLTVQLDPASRRVTVRSAGSPSALEVREGQWSDWLRVQFKMGMLQSVRGLVRFHLIRLEPDLRVLCLAGELRRRGSALPDQPPGGLCRPAGRLHRHLSTPRGWSRTTPGSTTSGSARTRSSTSATWPGGNARP